MSPPFLLRPKHDDMLPEHVRYSSYWSRRYKIDRLLRTTQYPMYQKSVEQRRRCQGRDLAFNVGGSCLKLKGLEPESRSTASLHATSFGKGPSVPGNLELAPKKTFSISFLTCSTNGQYLCFILASVHDCFLSFIDSSVLLKPIHFLSEFKTELGSHQFGNRNQNIHPRRSLRHPRLRHYLSLRIRYFLQSMD